MANANTRNLRRNMTEDEQELWRHLRYQRTGLHFCRRQPIGPYIVDFFCPGARIVVEVDGAPHTDEIQMRRGEGRTRWLEAHGCRVVRFWKVDVFRDSERVLDVIAQAAAPHPPPPLPRTIHRPPFGGKGN